VSGSAQPVTQVLVVDAEEDIVEFLEINLEREGFGVLKAGTGEAALRLVRLHHPALILLDVGLPDADGFEVCRRLRTETSVPIIMVTARAEDQDKMMGFETGADDYVVKPFNPRILVARIKAMLRRANASAPLQATRLSWREVHVDILRRKVSVGQRSVSLTPREYDLLLFFLANPGQVFSRDELLKEVWGSEFLEARSVDVHVKYLREKLESPFTEALQTVWGKGYKLALESA
jgi:DNA-binding response OmpR family regulator